MTLTPLSGSKGQRSRSPGRFTHRRVGASGSYSGGRGNVLAVGNCCYVAVCSAAEGASAPTGGRRGTGAYRGGRPPAYSLLCLIIRETAAAAVGFLTASEYEPNLLSAVLQSPRYILERFCACVWSARLSNACRCLLLNTVSVPTYEVHCRSVDALSRSDLGTGQAGTPQEPPPPRVIQQQFSFIYFILVNVNVNLHSTSSQKITPLMRKANLKRRNFVNSYR